MARAGFDWERIEAQYRAGTMSTREIAAEHGISHTAINKRAREEEWPRDLKAKVKARADALVSKSLVSTEVSTKRLATERQTVEVEAQVRARIELSQRADIQRARKLVMDLLAELEAQTGDPGLFKELGKAMESGDDVMLRAAYDKALSLAGRVSNMKSLAEALKTLIALERQAFKMDETDPNEAAHRQLSDLEMAAKLAYYVDLGRRRQAEAEAAE